MSLKSIIFHRSKQTIIGSKEIANFADIVGDHNPVHLDPEYAATTRFKSVISHGMLGAGHIYSLIPSNMMVESFEIKFRRPIYVSDRIKVELQIFDDNSLLSIITNEKGDKISEVKGKVKILQQEG